jgi:hypothetical protein
MMQMASRNHEAALQAHKAETVSVTDDLGVGTEFVTTLEVESGSL